MIRRLAIRMHLAILMLLVLGGAALAAQSPADAALLRSLSVAPHQTYAGTMVLFTWSSGSGDATATTVHHRGSGESRLEYLGAHRIPYLVVIDDGEHRLQYRPEERIASLEDSAAATPPAPAKSLELLHKNYGVVYGGTGTVAGRAADIVELVPRQCAHLSQRLWIDRQTGVVLRTEKYRLDGSLSSLSVYTDFDVVDDLPDRLFSLRLPEGVRLVSESDFVEQPAPPGDGQVVRLPAALPPGYVYLGAQVVRPDGEDDDVVHLRFTDGLGVISLFERPARPFTRYVVKGAKQISLKHGPGWLVQECAGYVLNWTAGDTNFTLVGEVPAETLIGIANSVPPGAPAGTFAIIRSAVIRLFSR
ncbi:MAG: sigma-E factor regulatory protein RseB domain-containing protein [Chitinophagales bacterium]